jgi:hypothetical protein
MQGCISCTYFPRIPRQSEGTHHTQTPGKIPLFVLGGEQ